MMSNTMSSIPAAAGAALLSTIGRSCMWLMKKYTSAPMTATAAVALTVGLAMAANNALYAQVDHHPAPLFFGSQSSTSAASLEVSPPVTIAPPPVRSAPLAQVEPSPVEAAPAAQVVVEPVAPLASDAADVSNSDLAEAQRKLQSLGLFDGEVDGFYGPKTAEAIRAFEMRNGMTPKGDMSRAVIDAIVRADATEHASINAARTTARAVETPVAAPVTPTATVEPDGENIVAGQRALQALISPQAETVAPATQTEETFAATTNAPDVENVAVETPAVTPEANSNPLTDTVLIERIQSGLASLGFLHSRIDGVAGEETARAIRNFEVFNNYEVTGSITPELVNLLIAAGADI